MQNFVINFDNGGFVVMRNFWVDFKYLSALIFGPDFCWAVSSRLVPISPQLVPVLSPLFGWVQVPRFPYKISDFRLTFLNKLKGILGELI
jgi:hypothetical protein